MWSIKREVAECNSRQVSDSVKQRLSWRAEVRQSLRYESGYWKEERGEEQEEEEEEEDVGQTDRKRKYGGGMRGRIADSEAERRLKERKGPERLEGRNCRIVGRMYRAETFLNSGAV